MPFPASLSRLDWRLSEGVRRRVGGLLAVALVHLALALLLISLAPPIVREKMVDMVMFSVDAPSEKPKAEEAQPKAAPKAEVAPTAPAAPPPPRPERPAEVLDRPELVIPMEPAAPVAPVVEAPPAPPSPPAPPRPSFGPPAPVRRGADSGADTPLVDGTGPNGEPLYGASWYREPYRDELAGYLSTARPPGWGRIACRTAPDYRVEDCVIVGEYPQGSGIARAIQAAAWQFKVRPPRVGGRYKVGEWVRIHFDYGLSQAGEGRDERRGR